MSPKITFGPSAAETVLENLIHDDSPSDPLSVDDEGYICQGDERLTDGYGTPISIENFGGSVHFPAYDFTVDAEGFVVDSEGDRISEHFEERSKEAMVAYRDNNGDWSGLMRDSFPDIVDFVEATRDDT